MSERKLTNADLAGRITSLEGMVYAGSGLAGPMLMVQLNPAHPVEPGAIARSRCVLHLQTEWAWRVGPKTALTSDDVLALGHRLAVAIVRERLAPYQDLRLLRAELFPDRGLALTFENGVTLTVVVDAAETDNREHWRLVQPGGEHCVVETAETYITGSP